jgi:hypothetical protein
MDPWVGIAQGDRTKESVRKLEKQHGITWPCDNVRKKRIKDNTKSKVKTTHVILWPGTERRLFLIRRAVNL